MQELGIGVTILDLAGQAVKVSFEVKLLEEWDGGEPKDGCNFLYTASARVWSIWCPQATQ